MNRSKLMRRLSVVAALAIVLAMAAGTPALQAQPEAGTISIGAGVEVWNGHNCPANVPVNIAGLSAGLGGYETKVGWVPPARFSSANADIAINIGTYLTNGGTRQQTGDSSTPPLKAVSSGAVKFGAYSWGAGNPPGNMAGGQLATVSLLPLTCGGADLTMSETQLVDVNGSVIGLTNQTGSLVHVRHLYDTNGDGSIIIGPLDVAAVVGNQGIWGGGCSPKYQYDTNLDGSIIIGPLDVAAVVGNQGIVSCP